MTTVDIHMHLLSGRVKLDRLYDKIAVRFFASRLGADAKALLENPFEAYCDTVIKRVRESKYLQKTVIFGVDARVDESGEEIHRDITVCATNEEVLKLYKRAPDLIIPFMSVNPMRPDALDLVDKYADLGFKGVKFLQNYWNVDTTQKRYATFFKKLQERELPLIVHIGSESSVESFKECESIEMLKGPLDAGVVTIAAHMGLEYSPKRIFRAFSKNPKHFGESYHTLLEMLQSYENLYADISAILTPVRAKALPHLKDQTEIHDRLLFGTDFPVPFTTLLNTHDLPFSTCRRLCKIENPFDRYVETLLEYFPKESAVWSNYKKVLNLTSKMV